MKREALADVELSEEQPQNIKGTKIKVQRGAKEEMEKIHSAGNRHDCSREEDSQIQGDLI